MSLAIASLNSGSNGNCYYIGNERDAVLVDAGLACREIERRMERLGLGMDRVRAVFISHEHEDHIRGVQVLSRRYHLPVYITEATRRNVSVDTKLVRALTGPVTVESLIVTPFAKAHDACDPCSFVVASGDVRVGVFTDIGVVCDNLIRHFMQCHAAFLETNYDEQMLEEGRYPYPLKRRIRGGQGHLSNRQSLELFTGYKPAYLSHLLLAHLSQDNNRPELAQALFEEKAGGTTIAVASRYKETEVFVVDGTFCGEAGPMWNAQGLVTRPDAGNAEARGAAGGPVGDNAGGPMDSASVVPMGGATGTPVGASAMRRRKTLTLPNPAQISLFNDDASLGR